MVEGVHAPLLFPDIQATQGGMNVVCSSYIPVQIRNESLKDSLPALWSNSATSLKNKMCT